MTAAAPKKPALRWREFAALIAIVTVSLILLAHFGYTKLQNMGNDMGCQANLKQFRLILALYAGEHHGLYPPIRSADCTGAPVAFSPMADMTRFSADYMPAAADIVWCPRKPNTTYIAEYDGRAGGPKDGAVQPCEITEGPWFYTAWAIPAAVRLDAETIARQAQRLAADPAAYDADWPIDTPELRAALIAAGWNPPAAFPRMRDGVERFYTTDLNNPAALAYDAFPLAWCAGPLALQPWHTERGAPLVYLTGQSEFFKTPTPLAESIGRYAGTRR